MIYWILLPVAILLFYAFSVYKRTGKQHAITALIQAEWGKPTDNYRDINRIAAFYNYAKTDDCISDSIAADIDLENLFYYTDRTSSKVGQQYLYHQLRSPNTNVGELEMLDTLVERLSADENIRADIQLELAQLNGKNAYYLHELFSRAHLPLYGKLLGTYIRLAWAIWIAAVALTVYSHNQLVFLLALGLTLFNFYLHYTNKNNILRYVHSLPQLYLLLKASRQIVKKTDLSENKAITPNLEKVSSLSKSLRYVNFEGKLNNDPTDLTYAVWELVKTMLLIEPAMFIASINKVNAYRDDIEALFNYIGRIDMAIAIQSFRLSLPYFSKPVFIPGYPNLSVTDLYHPLVESCVPNSLETRDSQGVLVTGSNMSGKTTFIRAMAVNTLLSQTLFTSCTHSYTAPVLQLFTSIRVSDDIEEHKSYFQAEALSVLNIIRQSQSKPVKSLVIIDEIFRGTNTIERVAAAKAILSYFTANQSFIFVSTHDLELAELLGDEYAVYCFEEKVADSRLVFDYKIKPGILKNKNAIAIMSGLGYPESVIADAYAMSEQLREKYKI